MHTFHTISVAGEGLGEMPGVFSSGSTLSMKFSLLEKFAYMAIYPRMDQEELIWPSYLGKVRKKKNSVIFLTFLLGKLINGVDPQENTSSHQGLHQQLK